MFTHIFRFDPRALAVDPDGQRLGEKYKHGAWICVACKILLGFCLKYDQDHEGDCPGFIRAVPSHAELNR